MTEAIPTRHGEGWRTPIDLLRVSLAGWYGRGARHSTPESARPLEALPTAREQDAVRSA